jgi:ABC-2 type transport system permease protein
LLAHYGVKVGNELVMDRQNLTFPAQTVRDAGGFQVQEIQSIEYPFFVDVRAGGMAQAQDVAGEVAGVMLSWASPVTVDLAKSGSYTVTTLLRSSPDAWLSSDSDIQPDYDHFPEMGFAADGDPASYPLAVAVQGPFSSYFRGKPRPPAKMASFNAGTGTNLTRPDVAQLDRAPSHARLLVVGSTEFVSDFVLQLVAGPGGTPAPGNLQYVQNAVDWAMHDAALLELRGRSSHARLLAPLDLAGQTRWVWITCTLVLAGLALVAVAAYRWRRSERPMELQPRVEFKQMPPIG